MNSQCPTCHTVFAVTDEQLDAHHGLVRCGKCRDIFNASWNLVDGDVTNVPAADDGSSPVPEHDDSLPPLPSREADARKAMLELLGDIDPETEAQLLEQAQQTVDTEQNPLPPVTEYDDEEELQLQIDPAVPRSGAAVDQTDTSDARVNRDSLQLELPAGFSDYADSEEEAQPDSEPEEEEIDLKFDTDPGKTESISRPGLELPAPPQDEVENSADEEIIIEAPPSLWGAFEEEDKKKSDSDAESEESEFEALDLPTEEVEPPATATQMRRAALKSGEPRGQPVRVAAGDSTSELSRSSTTMADDVRMVEIPQPKRFKTIYWVIAGIVLLLLILWQVKIFYFDDLAQSSSMRPVVVTVCAALGCKVPPRSALKLIQLSGTQVNQHPEVPGALQVTVNLVNRAQFTQALPPLEVTLTDKAGQIVGRRTYLAEEYARENSDNLPPNVEQNVFIDLAQPASTAVGYEVQLVGR